MSEVSRFNDGPSWSTNLTPLPPVDFFNSKLLYQTETGHLIWIKTNKVAGCKQYRKDGCPNAIRVGFNIEGRLVQFVAHRIVYAMNGLTVPNGMVLDHRDGNPFNNRLSNIRVATHSQNLFKKKYEQTRDLPRNVYRNQSGYGKPYAARVGGNHLGTFNTVNEATRVSDAFIKRHYLEFSEQLTLCQQPLL